jgi:hypothetical protein
MFARNGHATASDLSYWLGPLSPAFAALAASQDSSSAAGEPVTHEPAPEPAPPAPPLATGDAASADIAALRTLFHTLNNQLGVILTYAELIEAKAPDAGTKTRATQVVTACVDALATSKQIRAAVVRQ